MSEKKVPLDATKSQRHNPKEVNFSLVLSLLSNDRKFKDEVVRTLLHRDI